MSTDDGFVRCSEPVREALAAGGAVVALESTIFSNLGLPSPANREALERSVAAIEQTGAVPAITAVLDGAPRLGLDPDEWPRVLGDATKVAERDLGSAIAGKVDVGATTVSASLAIAAACGVSVFATGGIGGVHRDAATSGDISADLGAIARHPLITVCAGAKAFLDLPRTLEHLDTLSVPVVGWQTDEWPAFYAVTSGLPVPHRVDKADRAADMFRAQRSLGLHGGVLVGAPVPAAAAIAADVLEAAIEEALAAAETSGVRGGEVTPLVLAGIAKATAGSSIAANLALAENNAAIAAKIAIALAHESGRSPARLAP